MPTSQRAAIITGGSRGIGRAIAERLSEDGYAITLTYREREDAAQDVVAAVQARGGRAIAVRADLARADDVTQIFTANSDAFGRLDVLVLNAADIPRALLTEITEDAWDRAFLVNTRAAFLAYRHAARQLAEGGRVIAISTGLTRNPGPDFNAYAASKSALETLTRSFAHEVGRRGITVNTVQAGITDTDGMALAQPVVDMLVGQTPLGRIGQPADIASVVSFLASEDSRWITGETVIASGGLA